MGRPKSTLTDIERFCSKVNFDGPIPTVRPDLGNCWLWTAGVTRGGYGQFWTGTTMTVAHRWYYKQEVGPINYTLDHLCRVPACIRPSHMDDVTSGENTDRARPYRRSINPIVTTRPMGCDNGHSFKEHGSITNGRVACAACPN